MKQPELGKRLKEARISRKMTQSEVVGNFITRNMLSQIESGKAMPSVETLQYLSEVLGIPLQSLISSPSAHSTLSAVNSNDPLELLIQAKLALKSQDFLNALKLCSSFPLSLEDEASAISAIAYCNLAEQNLNNHCGADAAQFAQSAMKLSQKGLYANELVHSRALLLFNQAAQETIHNQK